MIRTCIGEPSLTSRSRFIVLRYSAFLATFPALFLTYIANNHCQTAFIFTQVGIVLVVASSGIVFAFYALAVWDNNIIISSILVTLYAIMVGCWVCILHINLVLSSLISTGQTAVITQYHAVTGLSVPFGSNCQIPPGVPWAPISYSSSVTFDVAVLVLVFLKLIVRRAQQSDFEYRTHSRVLAFLLITTITTITVLMIQALGSDFDLAKRSSAPFVIIITVAMGSRVFVDLRLFVEHRERTNHGLPYAANSSSQDRALSNVNYGKTVPYTTPPTAAVKSAIAQDTKKNLNPYTTFPSPPYSTSSFNISVGLPDKSKNGKSIEFSQQRKSGWV